MTGSVQWPDAGRWRRPAVPGAALGGGLFLAYHVSRYPGGEPAAPVWVAVCTRLGMSAATAKTHANRAMTKLGARDRAQLVVFAYRSGLAGIRRPR